MKTLDFIRRLFPFLLGSLVALGTLAWSALALGSDIVVIDGSGTKHTLRDCIVEERSGFYRSGTPFSGSIALDPEYKTSTSHGDSVRGPPM